MEGLFILDASRLNTKQAGYDLQIVFHPMVNFLQEEFFLFKGLLKLPLCLLALGNVAGDGRGSYDVSSGIFDGRDSKRNIDSPAILPAPHSFIMSDAFPPPESLDRKSTRLNSSHTVISYAVFCLKKKKYIFE